MKYSKPRIEILLFCLSALGIGLAGCGTSVLTPDNTNGVQEIESNNSFSTAQVVTIPSGQAFQISGTFQGGNDVDVYDLGTFQIGQTLTANLTGGSAVTPDNVQFGFFDQDQEVGILDDNATTAAEQNVSFFVRKAGKYYLALAESNLPSLTAYNYSAVVTVGSGTAPNPAQQIVYLNFNGVSSVTIWEDTFTNVQPFSAINNGMSPQAIAGQVIDILRADYTPYNIQFLSSYDTGEPAAAHTTIFISGSSNQSFYGLSDSVDWYNQNHSDRSIIFAGALNGSGLTQTQFVNALANIVAHELGHLCGLAHTVDHTELMDITTPLRQLAQPQNFHQASLAEFPIGTEDTLQLLQFSLGILQ
jgi:hypothetical protein